MISDSAHKGKRNPTLAVAREYAAAGLSVIPLKLDGSKAPAPDFLPSICRANRKSKTFDNGSPSWLPYQFRIASDCELERMFSRPAGIGIPTGRVSGWLEVLDNDDGSLFDRWYQSVSHVASKLPIIETPSGGYHVFYRCEEICGNSKIATDPSREKATLFETRGQGGYVAAVGSPWGIHKQGVYIQVSGPPLPTIPTITREERRELCAAARAFDKGVVQQKITERAKKLRYESQQQSNNPSELTPWDDFDRRADWSDILSPHQWTSPDGIRWIRPGKTFGLSAKVVESQSGCEVLTVYSANAGPLSAENGYKTFGKFHAWKLLNFNGDSREAARQARKLGYGGQA